VQGYIILYISVFLFNFGVLYNLWATTYSSSFHRHL